MKKKSLVNAFETQNVDKRIEVLKSIEKTGSISKAARDVGISYKAAWQAIDTLANLTGVCLVKKTVGGVGGGGAILTAEARALIQIASQLSQARQEVLSQIQTAPEKEVQSAHIGMHTSTHNYIPCTVEDIEVIDQEVARVFLSVNKHGGRIVAKISKTNLELLSLKKQVDVIAMFKVLDVKQATLSRSKSTTKNVLSGKVTHVLKGEKNNEYTLNLESEVQIVGFSPVNKKVKVGDEITVSVDESAIVLGLPSLKIIMQAYQTYRVLKEDNGLLIEDESHLIYESTIEIYCNTHLYKQIIATPYDIDTLVYGVLQADGMLSNQKIYQMTLGALKENICRVDVDLINKKDDASDKKTIKEIPWFLTLNQIKQGFNKMEQKQVLRHVTHATHAMAWLNKDGLLENVVEDVSRHAAFYKLIGQRVMQHRSFSNGVLLASSRISQAMVEMAFNAKIEVIVSVASPTAQAVALAQQYKMTIARFNRSLGMTLYCKNKDVIRIRAK